jgi:polyhydroxybutyrate depolymerase
MRVMRLLSVAIAVAACLSRPSAVAIQAQGAAATLTPGDHTFSIQHGGRSRSYIVHMPRGASPDRGRPVILAFHGGGGEAEGFKRYAGLDAIADREGVVVVYPYGSGPLRRRLLTWNAGDCCGYAMNQRVDDVSFAMAVLDDVARRVNVDTRRIYATGHSNGAMMSYRLGAERADRIVAIAPVAGSHDLDRFAPSRAVAVLDIHSVDDPRALYNGGTGPPFPGTNVRSSHRPVEESIGRWRVHNGCSAQPRTVETRKGTAPSGGASQTATLLAWDGCVQGGVVEHWKLTGVGHGWPGNARAELREGLIGPPTTLVVAAEEIWKFFSKTQRPQ